MSLISRIQSLSQTLNKLLAEKELQITTAESCTAGLISAYITSIPGSSSIFGRGFVTYSNDAKMELLNVKLETLQSHGAVSIETAKEMAEGALSNSYADISIAVTGIAGPDGATKEKPVGTVVIAISKKNGKTTATINHFEGTREEIRYKAAIEALNEAIIAIKA